MYQPCDTCPFRSEPKIPGSYEWLEDLVKGLKRGSLNHTCHKSDPKADEYKGHRKKKRLCIGILGMMKAWEDRCNSPEAIQQMMQGKLDWGKVPTRGVFQNPAECVRWHAKKILEKAEEAK